MARALVIGGTLFIGRALVEQLLERGDDVTIMHRGSGTPFGDRVSEIRCDRNDIQAVDAALEGESFDVVYDNVYDWERGTTGEQVSAAALAASPGLRRYVFMSSVAVYNAGLDFDESDPLTPDTDPNDYNRHKAKSERALFELHRAKGIPITTLRPAFVFGRWNPFPREAFFWDRMLADRPIVIPEDGSTPMQWVLSDDVARAAIRATEKDVAVGSAYNVASDPTLTQVEYVQTLGRAAGKEPKLVHVPRQQIQAAGGQLLGPPLYFGAYLDLPPITVNTERLRTELGMEPTPLEDGLRETFRWYEQQPRSPQDFSWEDRLLAEVVTL
ncbi:SDR family oxidoreductase [soil metagenome]